MGQYSIWVLEYSYVAKYHRSGVLYGAHNQGFLKLPYCSAVIKGNGRVAMVDVGYNNKDYGKHLGDKFGANISKERISLLDQQALVWFPTKGGTAKLQADPLYKNLKVRTQGRDVFIEENYDDQLYGATSFVSVLSLPIVLDELVPKLAAAVDGNPATNG